ncbi:MAG TPA: ferredoxin reductase [Solirubrobacteraceae bacterium]|nr:ferredoxin reductase [Solirubrobacteraceae bacterium]
MTTTSVQPKPVPWQLGTVTSIRPETPRAKSFCLRLPEWRAHLPGQYYTIRLTAPDGYQAIRSYSVASSPLDEGEIELTVDCLVDGEVSPFLHDVVEVGDELEVRGPLTEYFTWRGTSPLLLVGGGSGIVPLMSMLRHRRRALPDVPVRLVYSVRSPEDVFYRDELGDETTLTYTRRTPEAWSGATGRITNEIIGPLAWPDGRAYVCGPNGFVETATGLLMECGYEPDRIRTERFGPS